MGVLGTGMSNKPRNANELSEGQLHYAERLCSEYQNKVVFARWVEMKKTAKITRRIVVVGSYMVFVIKQARNKNSVLPTKKKTRFPGSLRLKVRNASPVVHPFSLVCISDTRFFYFHSNW